MKKGMAGSVESNDCLVTVSESTTPSIQITSIVDAFFHSQIENVIKETLKELKVNNVAVEINDKGALDYTIKARLQTALERMK